MGDSLMSDVEQAIRDRILKVGKLPAQTLGPTTELVSDLGMTSLDLLEVLASVEQRFDVTFKDEELDSLTNLTRIVKKVEALLDTSRSGPRGDAP
jgi:acyl carrier protein